MLTGFCHEVTSLPAAPLVGGAVVTLPLAPPYYMTSRGGRGGVSPPPSVRSLTSVAMTTQEGGPAGLPRLTLPLVGHTITRYTAPGGYLYDNSCFIRNAEFSPAMGL